jgi:hypothetical protein
MVSIFCELDEICGEIFESYDLNLNTRNLIWFGLKCKPMLVEVMSPDRHRCKTSRVGYDVIVTNNGSKISSVGHDNIIMTPLLVLLLVYDAILTNTRRCHTSVCCCDFTNDRQW